MTTHPDTRHALSMRITHRAMFRAAIERAGMSYGDVAARAECSKSFIAALAGGRKNGATPELAERIAEVLAIPVDVIFEPIGSGDSGSNVRTVRNAA